MTSRRLHAVAVWVALLAAGTAQAQVRRVALVVGNDVGAEGRAPLRYAEADARRVATVLRELGGFERRDLVVLTRATVADVERSVLGLRERLQGAPAGTKTVVLFYYSGHGDTDALELGDERLAHSRVRALLQGLSADLTVTVLDACHSGSMGLKGGRAAPAFALHVAQPMFAAGQVLISSSGGSEASMESNELQGGYFTHHLVAGLRGAADLDGDRQVTLNEAYAYAYQHTVQSTALSPVGAQHPSFGLQLEGQGELVLTHLARAPATLQLPSADRSLVVDEATAAPAAELTGPGDATLALPAGRYRVEQTTDARTFEARVRLEAGQVRALTELDFRPVRSALVALKGPSGRGPARHAERAGFARSRSLRR